MYVFEHFECEFGEERMVYTFLQADIAVSACSEVKDSILTSVLSEV